MSPDVLSVFSKFWKKKGVTFLHDSYHCPHCLKGDINFFRLKSNSAKPKDDLFEDTPQTFYKNADIKIYQSNFPKNSFCSLGILLTDEAVEKLKENNPGFVVEEVQKGTNKLIKNKKDCLKTIENKIKIKKELKTTKTKREIPKSQSNNNKLKTQVCRRKQFNNLKSSSKKVNKSNFVGNNKNRNKNFKINTKDIIQKAICKNILSNLAISSKRNSEEHKKLPKANSSCLHSNSVKSHKEPTLGTLKRKRWQMKNLKLSHESHEDDLFEDKKFHKFNPLIELMLQEDSDSEKYEKMITPRVSLSPVREGSSSPSYDDCYSPNELFNNRKEAEEYLYRREKRRKRKLHDEKSSSETSPEKYKNSAEYTSETLAKTCKILKQVALCKKEESDSEEEKDEYFSDTSD